MEQDNQTPKRRASDLTSSGGSPTISDVWRLTVEIREQVDSIERRQVETISAFITNDLGKPDYDGHRRDHKKLAANEIIMDGYKSEATKKILGLLVVFIVGLIASGLLTRITEHIK